MDDCTAKSPNHKHIDWCPQEIVLYAFTREYRMEKRGMIWTPLAPKNRQEDCCPTRI